ncbi:helix-turn-helix domain-containing protein [Metabacillus iocasae]|uniref:Transcriptional regulator with XRE-family HTH domain n=1 Tax=Priestia iocasae TaxID=2291674 RepID=A0ABS2QZF3_9BACI|nr:tetratricopeptide repeat protein [Metabacillus iocasae]MBM7704856.1 transcriptional regulator with XRE-family HTH domain [Metabacillus iocasae]
MHLLNDNFEVNIGTLISITRQEKEMTQEELAKGICSIPYLSKLENNRIEANDEIIALLLEKLGYDYRLVMNEQQLLNDDVLKWYQAMVDRSNDDVQIYAQKLEQKTKNIYNITLLNNYRLAQFRYYLYEEKFQEAEKLIDYFNKVKKKLTIVQSLYLHMFLGLYNCLLHHYVEGLDMLKVAEEISEKIRYKEPELSYNLALVHSYLHHPSLAIIYGHEALERLNASSLFLRSLDCQLLIAINYKRIKQFSQAEQLFNNILLTATKLKMRDMQSFCYHNLGNLYSEQGHHQKAIAHYEECLSLKKENSFTYLKTSYYLAKELVSQEKKETALLIAEQSIKLLQTISNGKELEIKFHLLSLEIREDIEGLEEYLENIALPFFKIKNDFRYLLTCYEQLAHIHSNRFSYKKSSYYYKLCNDIRKKLTN